MEIRHNCCRVYRGLSRMLLPAQAMLRRETRRFRCPARRIGVYSAYFNSSAFFEAHLECLQKNTSGPFDYYVMKNFTHKSEAARFDEIAGKYPFVKAFSAGLGPFSCALSHGDSLQRLISSTDNEIIVLCDIDALITGYGWDEIVLRELEQKEMVAVMAYFELRKSENAIPLVAHPSFMAFKRSLLEENRLDVLHGEGNDPAYKLSRHFIRRGEFNETKITPLLPTQVDFPDGFFPKEAVFGKPGHPSHGFCTSYGGFVFHFWFSRQYADRADIIADDGSILATHDVVKQKIEYYTKNFAG